MTLRTFVNKLGVTYDALKTSILFAEDLNAIVGAIPDKCSASDINTGTVDTKYVTPKAIKDSDVAFLSDIPASLSKATYAEINTGTEDTKFVTAKGIKDSDVAFLSDLPTLPVKNTGTEINTGTDDAKFATAKAIADSNISFPAKSETLTNKTLTKPVINGTDPTGATYTPATGAQTVALDVGANNIHIVSGHASGTAITFTIANATNNQPFIVSILQGGTTVSTITAWFATVRWAGGTVPTLTATLNKRDTFGFIRTGANTYDGFVIGQNC